MHLKAHRWAIFVAYAISTDRATGESIPSEELTTLPRSTTSVLCYDCGTAAPPTEAHCPDPPRPGYPSDSA